MVIPHPKANSHALLTRAPVSTFPKESFPCDLHVLGLPPAFVLSQDQTLRLTSRPGTKPSPRLTGLLKSNLIFKALACKPKGNSQSNQPKPAKPKKPPRAFLLEERMRTQKDEANPRPSAAKNQTAQNQKQSSPTHTKTSKKTPPAHPFHEIQQCQKAISKRGVEKPGRNPSNTTTARLALT